MLDSELDNLNMVTFAVIDFETTGTDPKNDRITEVGMVKVRGGEVLTTMGCLVKQDVAIPARITAMTGISNAMLWSAASESEVILNLSEQLVGTVIVGHNIGFDLGFLYSALSRADIPIPQHKSVDTLKLSRKLLAGEVENFQLGTLSHYLRIGHRPTHRALDDALATVELLHALIERATSFGCTQIDELEQLSRVDLLSAGSKLKMTTKLPHRPGVYSFNNAAGEPVYIGKATDLKSRVRSYFHNDPRRKVPKMLSEVTSIEAIIFKSPFEAHVAETRLLQGYRPRYNRYGTRSDQYLYIQRGRSGFTISKEKSEHQDRQAKTLLGPIRSMSQAKRCLYGLCFRDPSIPGGPDSDLDLGLLLSEYGVGILVEKSLEELDRLIRQQRYEQAEKRRIAAQTLLQVLLRQHQLVSLSETPRLDIDCGGDIKVLRYGSVLDLTPIWSTSGAPTIPAIGTNGLNCANLDELCIVYEQLRRQGYPTSSPQIAIEQALKVAIDRFTPNDSPMDYGLDFDAA